MEVEVVEAVESSAAAPASLHDYLCPICLELLRRPVVLSCGHRYCRGCWLRVLQGRSVRATAYLTGSVACPFRCEVPSPLTMTLTPTLTP